MVICQQCGESVPGPKFCGECGAVLVTEVTPDTGVPGRVEPTIEGEGADRRQLSIVFCDLAGSTELSEQLDPEDWRALIKSYQSLCSEVVARYDGYVAQYLGDGVLIYFGFPVALEDGAYRSVRCGLDIIEALAELSTRREQEGESPLNLRIGIHTGLVVVGAAGPGGNETLALGDTPNIAARLQGLAQLNQVVISSATRQLVSGHFEFVDQGEHSLKGVSEPVRLFTVERELPQLPKPARSWDSRSFVSRDHELDELSSLWRQAVDGHGLAVLLVGEAGVGKSRLVSTFQERILKDTSADVFEIRCLAHTRQSALHPFIDHLRREFEFGGSDPESVRLEKLESNLRVLGGRAAEVQPLFASLLSLPTDLSRIPLAERGERLRTALADWLVARCGTQPALIVVEDLHWADTSTIEVLTRTIGRLRGENILLTATCRDGNEPASLGPANRKLQRLNLGRLNTAEAEQLVRARAGSRQLPASLVAQLVERAEGVPLFVEELTRTVLESDSPVEIASAGIPNTLQDSLMARLDRLGSLKGIANVAATLGREFEFDLLREVVSVEPDALRQSLEQLCAADVIRVEPSIGRGYYAFSHALIQEAAYDSLLKETRRTLHRKVGEALEGQVDLATEHGTATRSDFVERLAFHWQRAISVGEHDESLLLKVAGYLREAGERAMAFSAYQEAVSILSDALSHLEPLRKTQTRSELELTVLARLAAALKATGWVSADFKEVCDRARALCIELGDRNELAPVLFQLWWYHLTNAQYRVSMELAGEARALARELKNTDLEMEALGALANVQFWTGRTDEALMNAERVLELYDPKLHSDHLLHFGQHPKLIALQYMVWAPSVMGRLDTAMKRHAEMESLVEELNHPFSTSIALCTSCLFHFCRRDHESTLAAAEAFLSLADKHGFTAWTVVASMFQYWALAMQGRAPDVFDDARELALSRWEAEVGSWGQSFVRLLVAETLFRSGNLQHAINIADAGLDAVSRYDEPTFEAELLRFKGVTLAALPDRQREAEDILRRAVSTAVDRGVYTFALRAAVSLVQLKRSIGEPIEESRALLEEQYGRFTEGFDTPELLAARDILEASSD